jgi:PST family polysaccharide transporter
MIPFDANGVFLPHQGGGGLRRLAVRGAGITVFAQGLAFAVQMIATVVLARLLSPSDFGVVTMVTTFSLLLASFGQNGYSEAIIQRDDIDHSLSSNLFWINFGVGGTLAAVFAAVGPVLAAFYKDPRVTYVAIAVSLTIFINGTSVVHLALLKRALRFSVTSAIDFGGGVVSVMVMILLAWEGKGYWALIVGNVARLLTQAIGAWYCCRWLPGLPRPVAGTRSVVRFALHVYGRFTVNYFARNTDNLLVGWRFGSGSLGYYKKAYDLFVLPSNQLLAPIADVVLSTLSRLNNKSDQYRRYFLNGMSILAFIGMGLAACLTLEGNDIIRLLLGPKWGPAGQIFTFFGPGIGIMMIYSQNGLIHLSIGRADRWFRWILIEFSVTGLLFLLGLRWGPAGVAIAWTASFWILTIPAYWYAGRPIQFGATPVVTVVWRYVVASLLAGCATAAIMRGLLPQVTTSAIAVLARILAVSTLFSALYIAAVVLVHGGWDPVRRVTRLLPDLVPWAKFSKVSSPPEAVAAASHSQ